MNRRQLVHFPHQSEYAMKQASDAATAKVEELDGRGYFKVSSQQIIALALPTQACNGFRTPYHSIWTGNLSIEAMLGAMQK